MYAADSSSAFVFFAFSASSFCFRLCSEAQHSERTQRAAGEWHEDLEAVPHRPQAGTKKISDVWMDGWMDGWIDR